MTDETIREFMRYHVPCPHCGRQPDDLNAKLIKLAEKVYEIPVNEQSWLVKCGTLTIFSIRFIGNGPNSPLDAVNAALEEVKDE